MLRNLLFCLLIPSPLLAYEKEPVVFEIEHPKLVLTHIPFKLVVTALDGQGNTISGYQGTADLVGAGRSSQVERETVLSFEKGRADCSIHPSRASASALQLDSNSARESHENRFPSSAGPPA